MKQEVAETRALELLAWLVGEEDLMPVFLGATGASADDVKARAANPDFLASFMDFLMMDDEWIIKAAEATGQAPESIAQIRAGLPGGQLPNWT